MDHYKNLWLKMKAKREAATLLGQQNSALNIEENDPDEEDAEEMGRWSLIRIKIIFT